MFSAGLAFTFNKDYDGMFTKSICPSTVLLIWMIISTDGLGGIAVLQRRRYQLPGSSTMAWYDT